MKPRDSLLLLLLLRLLLLHMWHAGMPGVYALGKSQGVFTLGDALSFSGLTSTIPPLGSMFNFDADVKKTTAGRQCENRFSHLLFS